MTHQVIAAKHTVTYDDDVAARGLHRWSLTFSARGAGSRSAGDGLLSRRFPVRSRPRRRYRAGQIVHAGQHLRHDAALHLSLRRFPLAGDGVNLVCSQTS